MPPTPDASPAPGPARPVTTEPVTTEPVTTEPVTTTPAGPVVVLGLMGSGKTTVAGRVARGLGVALRDSDVDIEAARHRTAGQIAAADGADALHALEADHLLAAVAERPPVVVAAAASTIEDDRCRAAMSGSDVLAVWLDAPDEVLGRRWAGGPHRPRFGPDVLAMLDEQGRRRRPLFDEVADLRLDTSAETPDELATRVLHRVRADADRDAATPAEEPSGAGRSVGAMVSPIDLQKALKGTSYPASKDALVEKAKSNDADSAIVDALSKIEDGEYDTPASLNHAIKEAGQV